MYCLKIVTNQSFIFLYFLGKLENRKKGCGGEASVFIKEIVHYTELVIFCK